MSKEPYPDVRALGRGIALMECLARIGWATPAELVVASGLDRATIYRLLATLSRLGYANRRPEDGAFALTRKVSVIAAGVRDDDHTVAAAGRHLARLVNEVKWPSDFARLLNGRVTIEESNHRLSPMTFHRATIGQERSLLRSALGKAILSILDEAELANVDELSGPLNAVGGNNLTTTARRLRAETSRKGYATGVGLVDRNVSAIAVPLRCAGRPCALNIVFFRNVLSPHEAARRLLPALQACADAIATDASAPLPRV